MGHIRLGNLPRTRKWGQVIELLEGGAGTPQLASAALEASQSGLQQAPRDEGLIHTLWLLTQMAEASRASDFPEALRNTGLPVSNNPTLMEVVGAFVEAVDTHVQKKQAKTDVGEMAEMAASETISSLVGRQTESLFGTTTADVQRAFKEFSTTKQFGILASEFFARFTRRYLTYFLSRELSNHVGGDKRFANIDEHTAFNRALDLHCQQAARIVESFSGGWFSKTRFEEGQITPEKAAGFIHVAMKKLRAEILKGGGGNG